MAAAERLKVEVSLGKTRDARKLFPSPAAPSAAMGSVLGWRCLRAFSPSDDYITSPVAAKHATYFAEETSFLLRWEIGWA